MITGYVDGVADLKHSKPFRSGNKPLVAQRLGSVTLAKQALP